MPCWGVSWCVMGTHNLTPCRLASLDVLTPLLIAGRGFDECGLRSHFCRDRLLGVQVRYGCRPFEIASIVVQTYPKRKRTNRSDSPLSPRNVATIGKATWILRLIAATTLAVIVAMI